MSQLSIIIAPGPWDPEPWRQAFRAASAKRQVHVWPDDRRPGGGGPYVICSWKADPRVFEEYPSPRAVFSLGAGVDHLYVLRSRPDIPVVRVIDPDLTMRMVEYVTFAVLYLHRQIPAYQAEQKRHTWRPLVQPAASRIQIGIMGAGVLGTACGKMLMQMGFRVTGWTRSPRGTAPFPVLAGRDGLDEFLKHTDILVSLLPNTPETAGLIDHNIFERLGRESRLGRSYFINAGRGETVAQCDLIAALAAGTLSGAVLDVFDVEPLPQDSPLWAMENVLLTPHIAADSDPDVIVAQILNDVVSLERGGPLENVVDVARGY
jgi:glyoxylate/hydroxypyruvate reductase